MLIRKAVTLTVGAVGVSAALAACGGSSGGKTASPSSSSGAAVKNAQGVTKTTITIGYTGPLSGPVALAGDDETSGIKAAVTEANAAGGINGRKIVLKTLDDQYAPAKQSLNLRQLMQQDKVFAIVGPPDAGILAQWPTIERAGVPVWGPLFPQDPKLKNVFILGSTTTGQNKVLMDHLCKEAAGKPIRIAGIYLSGTPYGKVDEAMVGKGAAACKGMKVVSTQKIPIGETNLTPVVLKAKAAKPDIVYMGATSTQDSLMMKVAGQQGFSPKFVGNGSTMAESGMEKLSNIQGKAYRASTILGTGPGVDAFAKAVAAVGKQPSTQGIEEYAITKSLLAAIKAAGDNLSWDGFIAAAEKLDYDSQIMSPTKLGPLPDGHRGATGVVIQKVEGQKWVDDGGFVDPGTEANAGL